MSQNFETRGRDRGLGGGELGVWGLKVKSLVYYLKWCKRAESMGYIVDLKTLSGNTFVIAE